MGYPASAMTRRHDRRVIGPGADPFTHVAPLSGPRLLRCTGCTRVKPGISVPTRELRWARPGPGIALASAEPVGARPVGLVMHERYNAVYKPDVRAQPYTVRTMGTGGGTGRDYVLSRPGTV